MNEDQSDTRLTESSTDDPPRSLSQDQFYRALAVTRRRRLLGHLLDEREQTVEELATVLTGWEATDEGTMATPADHRQLVTELVHVHLPLLDDAGLVSYDQSAATVEIEPLHPEVTALLRRSLDAESQSRP